MSRAWQYSGVARPRAESTPDGARWYPPPVTSELREQFARLYGAEPAVILRAPGRVNLIGEHTDYSGLPVLPIAIDRGTTVAVSANESGVVRASSSSFAPAAELPRAHPGHPSTPWHGYLAGALRELAHIAPGAGANVFIASDLPAQGGLSSSSALTVALVAGLAAAWGEPLVGTSRVPEGGVDTVKSAVAPLKPLTCSV